MEALIFIPLFIVFLVVYHTSKEEKEPTEISLNIRDGVSWVSSSEEFSSPSISFSEHERLTSTISLRGIYGACGTSSNEQEAKPGKINGYHKTRKFNKNLFGKSKARVGYEVEKINILGKTERGEEVGEFRIFRGIETDSSCGVEAITNVLPLCSEGMRYNYVKKMLEDARPVIDSDWDDNCGGHITISYEGFTGPELLDKIKLNLALFYSIYRKRLTNKNCGKNLVMHSHEKERSAPVNVKEDMIEFRLPPAVKNVEQLLRRHKLMALVVEHSFENKTFEELTSSVAPIILEMYEGEQERVEETIKVANEFHDWIKGSQIPESLKELVVKKEEEPSNDEATSFVSSFSEATTTGIRNQIIRLEDNI